MRFAPARFAPVNSALNCSQPPKPTTIGFDTFPGVAASPYDSSSPVTNGGG